MRARVWEPCDPLACPPGSEEPFQSLASDSPTPSSLHSCAWGPTGLGTDGPGSQQAWGQGARQRVSQRPLRGSSPPPCLSSSPPSASLSVIRGQFLCLSLHFCSWYGWSKLLNLLSNCFFICKMGIIAILPMGGCGYSVS